VLQPSDHFCSPPLDLLQQVHVLLVLRAPELNAVLQVASHQRRVEGQNPFPRLAGHASLDGAQDTVGPLGCQRTLPAHVQPFVYQYLQVPLGRAALDPFIPQPVLIAGITPSPWCKWKEWLTKNPSDCILAWRTWAGLTLIAIVGLQGGALLALPFREKYKHTYGTHKARKYKVSVLNLLCADTTKVFVVPVEGQQLLGSPSASFSGPQESYWKLC